MKKIFLLPALALLLNACVSTPTLPRVSQGPESSVFVWHDLISTDYSNSQTFYSRLLGWQVDKLDGTYATFLDAEKTPVAGVYNASKSNPGQQSAVWLCSVRVEDIDAVVSKIRENGGNILREPSLAPGRGSVALIADPQGAILQLVEPPLADITEETSPWIWHELMTEEAESAAAWYADIFNLTIEKAETGIRFILKKGDHQLASVSENPFEDTRNQWVPVLAVNKFDQILNDIPHQGGRILIPPSPAKTGGIVALILDPENAPLVLQNKGEDQ